MPKQVYRQKHGFIIMCDQSDVTSLSNVIDWIEDIYDNCSYDDVTVIVLANKCDMIENID